MLLSIVFCKKIKQKIAKHLAQFKLLAIWRTLTLRLLPKKDRGSPAYISDPLYPAMKRFWRGKPPVRYPYNVTIFRHVYDRERPERENRDHDNCELNSVVDIVALYVMYDDSPMRCKHYYCSAPGDVERTEVYVVPQDEFIDWLKMENSIPNEGVKLYENLPEKQS
jgi:hypothetical protein